MIGRNVTVAYDVSIGAHSYINRNSCVENCDIGRYCSISEGVHISPYNHYLGGLTTHPIGDKRKERPRVTIGNDVLISANVIILEGIKIGNGAVIGAGAVVTHDVENYEIVGGVPARHIRYRLSEDKRKKLCASKWWEKDIAEVTKLINSFERNFNEDKI